MAKKKKPVKNPTRGYATTSVASKTRDESNLSKDTLPSASTRNEVHQKPDSTIENPANRAITAAEPFHKLDESTAPEPLEDLEEQLERDELQLLVERHANKIRKDVARQVNRLATERRVSRSQAKPLPVSSWLPSKLLEKIIRVGQEDSQHSPYDLNIDRHDEVSEDELTVRLLTLQQTLSGLHLEKQQIDAALSYILDKRERDSDGSMVWGLRRSLEMLCLYADTSPLPDFEREPAARESTVFSEMDEEVESEAEISNPSVRSSTLPSLVTTDTEDMPDISDLDSDLEPDEMIPKYLALKTRLFELFPDIEAAPKQSKMSSTTPQPASLVSHTKAERKLQQQIEALEADILFDKGEANSAWASRRNHMLAEISARRQLGLDRNEKSAQPKPKASQMITKVEASQGGHDKGSSDATDDEDLLGGMFTELGPIRDKSTIGTGSHIADHLNITLRDFGNSSGIVPRRILEDACRARDSGAKLMFKQVSPTTYSCRHSLTITWTKAQQNLLNLHDVQVQRRRMQTTFRMVTISAINVRQSEDYVSVAALFSIFSSSLKEEKVYLRLPSTWRDVWHELSAFQKEKQDSEDRQDFKDMRRLIREKMDEEGNDELILPRRSRHVNRAQDVEENSSALDLSVRSEALSLLWEAKSTTPAYQKMLKLRSTLPISNYKAEILTTIDKNQVLILCGETGCGKSTQLPTFILEHALSSGRSCKIYCTEPRRISAISLAHRVSEELGEPKNAAGTSNSLVGYSVRLDSHIGNQTRLVYATVGIVLRMLESDTNLKQVTHLVIDEVHERSIDTDFLLIIVKTLLKTRTDLKVILMSATVDAERFSNYLDNAPILTVPGRTFPVRTLFLEDAIELTKIRAPGGEAREEDDDDSQENFDELVNHEKQETKKAYLASLEGYSKPTVKMLTTDYDEYRIDYNLIARLIEEVGKQPQLQQYSKAFLVFLPGIAEIRELYDLLVSSPALGSDWSIYALHSTISSEEQQQAFADPGENRKKIVLSTNIAETGVTIPDITCVIDTGKHKEMRFDERRQLSRLLQAFIARSNAKQRRGRAGRVQEGLCFHLFSKYRHDNILAENQTPELLRLSLQDLVMRVKICNLGQIEATLAQALDPPAPKNVQKAIATLVEVGALTPAEDLTPLGQQLAKLPLDAVLGKLCLLACTFKCADAGLTIAAILSSKSPFYVPFGARQKADAARLTFKRSDSDLLTAYSAYLSWKSVCSMPGQSEYQYCRKNFLSPQNLGNIEDVKSQLLNALVDAGALQLSSEDKQAMKRGQHSSRHRSFASVPQAYNVNSNKDNLINAVIAWSFYPKLLVREGKGWRNVANNQSISLHTTSVNKGTTTASLLSYYSILQSNNKFYNAMSTNVVHELPLVLFAGTIDFRLHAGVVVIDGNRLKFSFSDWKTMCAVKILRARLEDIVSVSSKAPGKPLSHKLERWLEILEEVFEEKKQL